MGKTLRSIGNDERDGNRNDRKRFVVGKGRSPIFAGSRVDRPSNNERAAWPAVSYTTTDGTRATVTQPRPTLDGAKVARTTVKLYGAVPGDAFII